MAPRARPNFKPERRPTFIKAWRKHHGDMSQEKLAERLMVETGYEISPGQLSRIESGKQPYTQDFLEAAATVLGCEPSDLIMRDPTDSAAPWSLLEGLEPAQRETVVQMINGLKKTGTHG